MNQYQLLAILLTVDDPWQLVSQGRAPRRVMTTEEIDRIADGVWRWNDLQGAVAARANAVGARVTGALARLGARRPVVQALADGTGAGSKPG